MTKWGGVLNASRAKATRPLRRQARLRPSFSSRPCHCQGLSAATTTPIATAPMADRLRQAAAGMHSAGIEVVLVYPSGGPTGQRLDRLLDQISGMGGAGPCGSSLADETRKNIP